MFRTLEKVFYCSPDKLFRVETVSPNIRDKFTFGSCLLDLAQSWMSDSSVSKEDIAAGPLGGGKAPWERELNKRTVYIHHFYN